MDMLLEGAFWVALSQIMLVNIVLSGDNAVVIALACRNLPVQYRRRAILAGSGGAIVLRIIFCVVVAWLLQIPYLKIVGALLLFWIGIKLITEDDDGGDDGVAAKSNLWGAIQTIIIADAVMSLDNAIAIAAAAEQAARGDETRIWVLITLGLIITIPIIIVGATIIMRIMQRYPIVIVIGGALLGFVAGEMLITDPALHHWVEGHVAGWFKPAATPGSEAYAAWLKSTLGWIELGCGLLGAALTIVIGRVLLKRAERKRGARDLSEHEGETKDRGALATICILVPTDGSANSDRAVRYAIGLLNGGTLHVLNVQPPSSGAARKFVSQGDIDDFRREDGEKALASAVKLAAEAGIAVEKHITVGRPGELAGEFARRVGATMIVMGTRGHTGLAGVLLGSVAQEVISGADVPVCLVK